MTYELVLLPSLAVGIARVSRFIVKLVTFVAKFDRAHRLFTCGSRINATESSSGLPGTALGLDVSKYFGLLRVKF